MYLVALLAEGVDRNSSGQPLGIVTAVALLAEGVDRNLEHIHQTESIQVALLAEGVDRNIGARTSEIQLLCRPPRGGRG